MSIRTFVWVIVLGILPLGSQALSGQAAGGLCGRGDMPGAVCGSVEVPETHGGASDRTLALNYMVLPARLRPEAPDPIVILLGGPGQAATDFAAAFAKDRTPEAARRDVVLIDQRGTGASNPLECPRPSSSEQYLGQILPSSEVLDECRRTFEGVVDLRRYGTRDAARDLDLARRRLGYQQLNLVGISYGTRLALEYVRMHPEAVRTVTLQGVAPHEVPIPAGYARAAQEALDSLIEDCERDPACANAHPELRKAWVEIMTRARIQPIDLVVEGTAGPVPARLTANDLGYAVRGMLYGPEALSLPSAIYEAWKTGDFGTFATAYVRRAERVWRGVSAGMHISLVCREDLGRIDPRAARLDAVDTFLGSYILDEYRRACDVWGVEAFVPSESPDTWLRDTPALLISGRRDPVTPSRSGDVAAAHFTNVVHYVHPWGGHGFPGTPDGECAAAAREAFLRTADVDAVDTACVPAERPLPFAEPVP